MSSDALLLVSYGSPERREDVEPFLQNLLSGTRVSQTTLDKVAEQYDQLALHSGHFSPLASQCQLLRRELIRRKAFPEPIFWGNLFWNPLLVDTIHAMCEHKIRQATAFITSPFESELSRKRYSLALENARELVGPQAPEIEVLPAYGNSPFYHRAVADRILEAAAHLTLELDYTLAKAGTRILFTAHSLPLTDAGVNDYAIELERSAKETMRLMQQTHPLPWDLVFQSRGGKPIDPWLEPDIRTHIRKLAEQRDRNGTNLSLLIVPVGFLLENKETAYDLDIQVMSLCDELRIPAVRAEAAGVCPAILKMIEESWIANQHSHY